ncbi:MAG: transmembrane anchor protein [Kiloniellales bacterium]|nr:transmembrane anchor protein [Kiloniellales bacterium]
MYNAEPPKHADLPTTKRLLRSTIIAIISAIVILVTIVLPAEYAIDPTGIGRFLGLAEMGEIKTQLAKEAEEDKKATPKSDNPAATPGAQPRSSLAGRIFSELFIRSAAAETRPAGRSDKLTITLKPAEGKEVKMTMKKGAKVAFAWTVSSGVVNYDLHGDGSGRKKSYKKGRGVPGAEGTLTAAFDGSHGWFWRNRGKKDVTVTLTTRGQYSAIKQVK